MAGILLSAVLLSFCFPSGGLWWLAWIAFVPFIIVVRRLDWKVSFRAGYLAGFLFFALTLFWIHHVTWIGLLLLSAYLALYWAVFACAVSSSATWTLARRVLFLSAVWAAGEYVRAQAFTGFGWASLAHTQSNNILLIQFSDITGTYGVSFVLMAFNVVAAEWVARKGRVDVRGRRAAWAVILGMALLLAYGMGRLSAPSSTSRVRVALVQGNISLADYADPNLKDYVVERHLALSRQALAYKPDLILWPETSFPQFIWDHPELFEKVRAFAREHHVKLMLGAVTRSGEQYFNTAILMNGSGETKGMYSKQHLVILGEYIPFRRQLPWLARFVPIDDFSPGVSQVLLDAGDQRPFAALICFEDTIPALARAAVNGGAGFLVNITNDGWFGASRQPAMHLDNAVFRAVENRVSLLRATNTGVSCGILPTGEITGCVADGSGPRILAEGVSVVDVPSGPPQMTFYRKFGDIFAMLCFAVILSLMLTTKFIRENKDV